MSQKSRRFTGFALALLMTAFAVSGCLSNDKPKKKKAAAKSSQTDNEPDFQDPPEDPTVTESGAGFSINVASGQALDLGVNKTATFTVKSTDKFSGTVNLTVDRGELTGIAGADDVTITLTPTQVNLTAGQSAQVEMKIVSKTSAPSFSNKKFKIKGTIPGGKTSDVATTDVPLTVNAVYEVKFAAQDAISAPNTVNFRTHANGVRVKFINTDTQAHRVHSSGAIAHQQQDMAPNGGTYDINVSSGAQAKFYCHTHGGAEHTFNFNVANPVGAASAAAVTDSPQSEGTHTQACDPQEQR